MKILWSRAIQCGLKQYELRRCGNLFYSRAHFNLSPTQLSNIVAYGPFLTRQSRGYCAGKGDETLGIQPNSSNAVGSTLENKVAGRLYMVFTCRKCDTRAVKSFTKSAYEKGVVILRCPGCDARHLIADNLGWFGEERNIEEVLAKRGEPITRIKDDDLVYSP